MDKLIWIICKCGMDKDISSEIDLETYKCLFCGRIGQWVSYEIEGDKNG